jgi:hypothetical protein
MQQMWGSPLGVLENPLLATPPPKGFGAYREELLDTPEKVPFSAPSFVAARKRLLAIRNHMGRRPIPKDLKVRATFPEPSGSLDMLYPGEEEEPTTGNAVAGALLLKLVRGEDPNDISQEGVEQGSALLSLFKGQSNGHGNRFKKDFMGPHSAVSGMREQRSAPGANGVPTGSNTRAVGTVVKAKTVPVAVPATPSRAEIRKAAAAARELEKSSKLDDTSDKVKTSVSGPTAEAGAPKGQSMGRSRNAKRAALGPPGPIEFQ